MKILFIAPYYTMPDRASGDLRLSRILRLLAKRHELSYHAIERKNQAKLCGRDEGLRYKEDLRDAGITVVENIWPTLIRKTYDFVFFEFFYAAKFYISAARFWQPQAKIIIDSVDVHFQRMLTKARLHNDKRCFSQAARIKKQELATYKKADLILAVTSKDKQILEEEVPELRLSVIPNIHETAEFPDPKARLSNSLLFVGGFSHLPNVDAVLYFCREVLPLIHERLPDARLTVVGSNPPAAVTALSNDRIEITGYVPDMRPYLTSAFISVAPLRYGAGMKGKIGEAMSFGLPVVTTEVGMEGFGLTPGENVLVGNTAPEFSEAVVALCRDRALYDKIGLGGWLFMKEHFSESLIAERLYRIFDDPEQYTTKKISLPLTLARYFSEVGRTGIHRTAKLMKRALGDLAAKIRNPSP